MRACGFLACMCACMRACVHACAHVCWKLYVSFIRIDSAIFTRPLGARSFCPCLHPMPLHTVEKVLSHVPFTNIPTSHRRPSSELILLNRYWPKAIEQNNENGTGWLWRNRGTRLFLSFNWEDIEYLTRLICLEHDFSVDASMHLFTAPDTIQ